ncbi:major facilitator superfamily protein [Striga asiatica]|uniref:Major facilitator superfamily protein n=1 Tax=Striga asiatica TaxID=4170 RepID=A0A5A7RJ87_STRAF|nr:major facilitator superfamily protein [Striga asiatica]
MSVAIEVKISDLRANRQKLEDKAKNRNDALYFINPRKLCKATEFSERLSYFGLSSNLIIYLTKVIKQDLQTAAKSVNYWSGVTTLMPLLGGFLADAYFGRFSTILASSIIYLLVCLTTVLLKNFQGLLVLTMSRVIPSLEPCGPGPCPEPRKIHVIIFFLAMYLISIGTGGHKPSLESFGADQFDDDHAGERKKKMSFFNWWCFGLCCGLLLGVTVIVYIQDHIGWATADVILTSVMAFTVVIFLIGRPYYRFRRPNGSPLTPLLQVLVAAFVKRNLEHPSEPGKLHEVSRSGKDNGMRFLVHTERLKFLDKAAIVEDTRTPTDEQNPWHLATVTRVEEVKLLVNMIPIWLTTLPFGICVAQSSTFFIKQSVTLDRRITSKFEIPPASIQALSAITLVFAIALYDRALVPFLRRLTGNDRGINLLTRIGTGMIFSVLTMMVAALVEKKRLDIVEKNGSSQSMSAFWLAPQYVIIAIGDTFTLIGLQEYFYDQVPDSMRSLGIAFYLSVLGASSFASGLLITIVDHVTGSWGTSWFGKDLNHSRLDYFYWFLCGITSLNLCVYAYIVRKYPYKNVRRATVAVADCDGVGMVIV